MEFLRFSQTDSSKVVDAANTKVCGSGKSVKDMQELRRMFDVIDENKDGSISNDELASFMKKLGFSSSAEEIASMVSSVDTNGDGYVDFNEFAILYNVVMAADSGLEPHVTENDEDDDLKEAFHVFDRNDDGYITALELHTVLLSLGMIKGDDLLACEKMINTVDTDGNGRVDFHEFKQMMTAEFGKY